MFESQTLLKRFDKIEILNLILASWLSLLAHSWHTDLGNTRLSLYAKTYT